jgi:MFS transporter, ACS family, hexuronate transporter
MNAAVTASPSGDQGLYIQRAWVVLALLGATGFLFRFDREVFSILKTTISRDLLLSNSSYGLLVTAYLLPFTAGFLFCGAIIDRWGTSRTLWLFVIGMSLATIGTGLITHFSGLLACRVMLGLATAGVMPGVLVAITCWFPVHLRTTAFTIQSALHNCGGILAPPLVAGISLMAGWPLAFVVPGLVGLVVASGLRYADRGAPFACSSSAARRRPTPWRQIIGSPLLRRLILARMCSDPFWFFLFYWQAAFLQEQVGLSLADLGKLIWIPPAFSVVATLMIGPLNDRMVRAGNPPVRARLRLLGLLTLIAPLALLLPWLRTPVLAICAITLVYTMCNIWLLLTNLLVADIMPSESVGASFGLVATCGGVTSVLFNLAAGPMIDAFGHTFLLSLGAVMHPCAWLLLARLDSTQITVNPAAVPDETGA